MKKIMLAGLAGAALMFSTAAFADPATEVKTAATHAGLAAKAGDINMVHTHLHHALNCLVGPKGEGFDAGQANPCAAAGAGAIPDTTDAAMKTKLEAAAKDAAAGIAATDLKMAQDKAMATAKALSE
ncbi:MAG: hypothetical protein GC155_07470 [Alphaproteobacteria bacterium]|nr:hypothetical protein [Alphaproteobacteria bacterium]